MSLLPPITVGKLQTVLHTKAKNSPDYRFYTLYDKLYRRDVLQFAYERSRANRGKPGVDRQTFADIEEYGLERWLDELTEELRNGTYRPRPVRRVFIPKGDGKLRPLGIPCIKDRVVQMAAVLVLEPIFEADLEPEQHAYRPESQRPGRRSPSGTAAQDGTHRCGGRRPFGLLRQYSPCGVDEIDVPSDQRRPHAAADQDVAGNTGGRDRRVREPPSDDPEQGPRDGNAARCSDLPVVVQHLHAALCEGMEGRRA